MASTYAASRSSENIEQVPGTNVVRIMRSVIPTTGRITDEAKQLVQKCVAEYINFITGVANQHCSRESRKTLTAQDILYAMAKLGFHDYLHTLTLYLNRYRQIESQRATVDGDPVVFRTSLLPTPPAHPLPLNLELSTQEVLPPPPGFCVNLAEAMNVGYYQDPFDVVESNDGDRFFK